MKTIKILIVDDSVVYRQFLISTFAQDPSFEVVATAADAMEAQEKLKKYEPDVMTLDLEMPGMNGIEFLNTFHPRPPLPVIVISSANERVFEALNAGAVDFVAKQDLNSGRYAEGFIADLKSKVKVASVATLLGKKQSLPSIRVSQTGWAHKLLAIGASTGGTEAILDILKALPKDMPGIVVVQHMPPVFTQLYAKRLDSILPHRVQEAKNGDLVSAGCVLIAPGDQQMKVVRSGGIYRVNCYHGEKVSGHCPSVDVLFESVAQAAGKDAVGVLLTGMGADGSKGLLSMRKTGAKTIGQDQASSVVYGMPKVAYELGAVLQQAPLDKIPQLICSFLARS